MNTVNYKPGDRVTMTVRRADNVLLGYLADSGVSRRKVYERMTDNNPSLRDEIDISPSLGTQAVDLLMSSINFTSGGKVEFLIEVDGRDAFRVEEDLPEYNSKSWHVIFQPV